MFDSRASYFCNFCRNREIREHKMHAKISCPTVTPVVNDKIFILNVFAILLLYFLRYWWTLKLSLTLSYFYNFRLFLTFETKNCKMFTNTHSFYHNMRPSHIFKNFGLLDLTIQMCKSNRKRSHSNIYNLVLIDQRLKFVTFYSLKFYWHLLKKKKQKNDHLPGIISWIDTVNPTNTKSREANKAEGIILGSWW